MSWPPFTRLHVQPSCATQLHQSAALRHATAHTAATSMPWLLWREPRNYIIMVWACVSVAQIESLLVTT